VSPMGGFFQQVNTTMYISFNIIVLVSQKSS
jgi:hypothetical protein